MDNFMHLNNDDLRLTIDAIDSKMGSLDLRDKEQYEKYDALQDLKAKFEYELVKRTQVHR